MERRINGDQAIAALAAGVLGCMAYDGSAQPPVVGQQAAPRGPGNPAGELPGAIPPGRSGGDRINKGEGNRRSAPGLLPVGPGAGAAERLCSPLPGGLLR